MNIRPNIVVTWSLIRIRVYKGKHRNQTQVDVKSFSNIVTRIELAIETYAIIVTLLLSHSRESFVPPTGDVLA